MLPLKRDGVYIVVVQNEQAVLREIKSKLDIHSPNHVVFTREPMEVVSEVLHNPVDIVVSGQHFYKDDFTSFTEMFSILDRWLREGILAVADDLRRIRQKAEGPRSGTELTSLIYKFNPNILVMRYSATPESPAGFVADIEKLFGGTGDQLIALLNHPEIAAILKDRDASRLKRALNVRFYDDTLADRFQDRFIAQGTAEALDFYVARYVGAAALVHQKRDEMKQEHFQNICAYSSNMFSRGLQRQIDLRVTPSHNLSVDDVASFAEYARKAIWTNPSAIRSIQERYLRLRPEQSKSPVLLK